MAASTVNQLRGNLARYSTCSIADALLKLKQPCGGLLPGITLWSPERQQGETRLVGQAYTVRFVQNFQTNAPVLERHYIDGVPRDSVIFISAPKGLPNAVYGGLMSHRARFLGSVGTVIDGNFRDLDEQRKLGHPVFARDISTTAYYEVARASEVNVPVRLHDGRLDVVVNPGDWIVGDLNGVVCIPQSLAGKVAELLPAMEEAEMKTEADLAQGATFAGSSKTRRSN